jgi:hypothetical protein
MTEDQKEKLNSRLPKTEDELTSPANQESNVIGKGREGPTDNAMLSSTREAIAKDFIRRYPIDPEPVKPPSHIDPRYASPRDFMSLIDRASPSQNYPGSTGRTVWTFRKWGLFCTGVVLIIAVVATIVWLVF